MVVGYTWTPAPPPPAGPPRAAAEATPAAWDAAGVSLRWWPEAADAPLRLAPVDRVSFRLEPGRWCVGHSDGDALVRCPTAAPATRGVTCDACAARDAFRPCMTCDGFRCPRLSSEMLAYCRQPHHLYLACFGDETVKVGTASGPRRVQRIVEQGPLAAARVAVGPGPTVKQMEALLARQGFAETMRRARKTALLQAAMTEEEARRLLLEAAALLRDALPEPYHPHLGQPDFVAQPSLARRSRALPVQALELADGVVVEGDLVGAVGHLAYVRDSDGTFALDLGELKGRRITLSPSGPRRKPAAQLGLFR